MKAVITKLLFLGLVTSVMGRCASSGPPLPPSLELPVPVTDLRAVRKGDRVYLAWTVPTQTTDHQAVRHLGPTLICRSTAAMTECGSGVGEVAAPPEVGQAPQKKGAPVAKVTATYVDQLPTTASGLRGDEVTYAVEVLNLGRRGAGLSNQVREPSVAVIPPPEGFRAEVVADGVRLSWSCISAAAQPSSGGPGSGVQYKVRIYRRLQGSQGDINIAEPDLASCQGSAGQSQSFEDQTFEWEKTYEYRAAPVMVISEAGKAETEIEGDDTPSMTVFAHDVFPPAVPSGLQAVFSGVGQAPFVDLIWSPNTEADRAGYNVYRHEENGVPVKLNSELVKAPAYRDNQVQAGQKYFYSVTAVDVRGNESAKSEEANEAVP